MWLLKASVLSAIRAARAQGFAPTAQQQQEFTARLVGGGEDGNSNRLLTIVGDTAEIAIRGILTNAPDFMALFFGGGNVTYPEIIEALASAEQDPAVTKIVLAVDSPGGVVSGLFDTLGAIRATSKPITAIVHNMAASAAFALVAQADTIEASDISARFGSIGIRADVPVPEDIVTITSTAAPKKAPDVTTAEGLAMAVEELDAMHQIFAEAVADGRGTTVEKVNADFGQGATILAADALKRGMIDSVRKVPLKSVKSTKSITAASGGNQLQAKVMNLEELKAQHPDVFKAAVDLGVGQGVEQERDRVTAHLISGEASGQMETALKAAKDGSVMTETLRMSYLLAAKNGADIEANQSESDLAAAGDHVSTETPDAADVEASAVADLVEAGMGLELSAAGGLSA